MPDYIPYTPPEYAPDAPATALHFQRWFENHIAAMEGMPGAPRLFLHALERLEAGNEVRWRSDGSLATAAGNGPEIIGSIGILQHGEVRARITRAAGQGAVQIRRVRAGQSVVIASISTNTTLVANVLVIPGDTIIFAVDRDPSHSTTTTNRRIMTAGQDLWPAPINVYVEGNRAP